MTVPDTVDYFVQGFTIEKDYTWTVNEEEVPSAVRANQTYVWERREGEFVTLVFSLDDRRVNVDPASGATPNTLTVNASGDDINAETVNIDAVIPSIGDQLARLPNGDTGGNFEQATGLGSSSGIGGFLTAGAPGGDQSYTLFAPTDAAVAQLGAVPTQATDDDESALSSVRADILKYHALGSRVGSGDLTDGPVPTLFGGLDVQIDAANLEVGRANILGADFPVLGNGLVHTIDQVLLPPTASSDYTDRDTTSLSGANGDVLTVDGVYVPPPNGGFVVVHDSTSLEDDGAIPSIAGKSAYLSPGVHNGVQVPLDAAVTVDSDTTLGAMPHEDTDGDQTYDFETSGGTEDGPYTLNGAAVIDFAEYAIQ